MPVTSESRIITAPLAEVWAAVTALEQAARWNQAWQRVEYLTEQREGAGTVFRAYNEEGLAHNFRISEWAPMEYVAFEPLRDEGQREPRYPLTLDSQAFLLSRVDEGRTGVTLFSRATGHGLRGWLAARFVWPAYQRHGLRSALDALQAMLEPPEDEDAPSEEATAPD